MSINNAIKKQYLEVMGVQVWQERGASRVADAAVAVPGIRSMSLNQLLLTVNDCQLCELSLSGESKVFPVNANVTKWFIVSDVPLAENGNIASIFTEKSGFLLREILSSVAEKIETTYITTAIKCVQAEQAPSRAQLRCCQPYLMRQIALLKPDVVLLLGESVAQSVLSKEQPLQQLRGQLHTIEHVNAPMVVTHHPDLLLTMPLLKREVWQDVQLAKALVEP